MKSFFSICLLLIGLITLTLPVISQTSSSPLTISQGEAKAFGGTTSDSLLAGDSLTYYFQVKSPVTINSLIQLYYDETAGSQTTNITIYGANANNESEYVALKRGLNRTAWVSGALTADANVFFDTELDTVIFNRRFIKIQAISSGSSSKGTLRGVIKTYSKP